MKKIFAVLLTLFIVFTSSTAFSAEGKDGKAVIVDALILRPVGLVTLALGGTFYIITLPLAAITRNVDETTQALVVEPFNYTFVRPMGDNDWQRK